MPTARSSTVRSLLAVILFAAVAACGSDDASRSPGGSEPAQAGPQRSGAAASPAGRGGGGAGGADGSAVPGGPASAGEVSAWARIPEIVAEVAPSVVSILSQGGEGSGVIWSEDGIIVTNWHVVEGAREVVVAFADGTRSPGEVVAGDPLSDLAVVRTERTGLPAAEFADAIPPVGSLAVALGNPLGFENSATAGIVSGTQRAVPGAARAAPALVDLLQTDAAISPGNSGGALVGEEGEVLGINVAYIPPQARAVSIGFAIPAPTVTDVVEQLLEDGSAEHAYLGVRPAPLTPQIAGQLEVEAESGAIVLEVVPGSPAAEAGIESGDVVVGIGDDRVDTVEDLLGSLRRRDVGEEVVVRIVRGGDEQEIRVVLGSFPIE